MSSTASVSPGLSGSRTAERSTSGRGWLAKRAEAAEAGEEFVGGGDVAADLRAEFFRAGKFFFVAEALPEVDFDATRSGGLFSRCGRNRRTEVPRSDRFRQPIQNMRFDAEGGAIERGAHADVRDRAAAEAFAFEAGTRDVNAALGKQALFGSEV